MTDVLIKEGRLQHRRRRRGRLGLPCLSFCPNPCPNL